MQICNRSVLCGLIACLALFGANPACFGQTRARQETQTTTSTEVRRVSTMIGSSAQLRSGARIGTVKDLIISKQSVVKFVVVAFEESFILVPFDVAFVDIDRQVVIIDVERERFHPFRRVARLTEFLTLSTLLRTSIVLRGDVKFGLVEDLVISSTGNIDFVVVAFEQKFIAVPFSLARVDFTKRVVSIDVTRERLLQAPSFTRDRFPNLSAKSEFSQRANTFFQVEKGRGQQPAESRPPATRPPDKRTPESRPPESRPPESKPPDKRPPESRPPEKRSPDTIPPEKRVPETRPPEKRAPETKPPDKRPPKDKPPENRPSDTKPPDGRPSEKNVT